MVDAEWQDRAREAARAVKEQAGSIRAAARKLNINHESLRRVLDGAEIPRGKDREVYLSLAGQSVTNEVASVPQPDTRSRHSSGLPPALQFGTEAERRAAALAILHVAQQLGPQLVQTVDQAVQTLTAPIVTLPAVTPAEEAHYQRGLLAGAPAGATAAADPLPPAKRRARSTG